MNHRAPHLAALLDPGLGNVPCSCSPLPLVLRHRVRPAGRHAYRGEPPEAFGPAVHQQEQLPDPAALDRPRLQLALVALD